MLAHSSCIPASMLAAMDTEFGMAFYFDGTGQRTHKEEEELEREDEELLRPAPGKSSRTHGGSSHASGIPGKVSLTMRLAQRIDRYARDERCVTPNEHIRALVATVQGSPSQRLPESLRHELEAHAGADLSEVRVHIDTAATEAAQALNALAFTVGQDIHFADGAYAPDSAAGRRLLAHEVAHTIQQRGQSVSGQDGLEISQPGDAGERQADEFAGLFERAREADEAGDPLRPIGEEQKSGRIAVATGQRSSLETGLADGAGHGATDGGAKRPATVLLSGDRAPGLSSVPLRVQRQESEVQRVGHVAEHRFDGELHRVGDSAESRILMDIELGANGAVTYRWFDFETASAIIGTPRDWSHVRGAVSTLRTLSRTQALLSGSPYGAGITIAENRLLAPSRAFDALGRQLRAAEWRRLWPNPIPELLNRYEDGRLRIDAPAILSAYRGQVRKTANAQLDENERRLDEFLGAPERLARLQEYADGLREASLVRDQLETRRAELQQSHTLAQAHSFNFGLAGNLNNMAPTHRISNTTQLHTIEDAIAGWYAAFPLLSRLRTAEIHAARIEATLQMIKANIIETRPRLAQGGGLDPMELENTRAQVARRMRLGPRASAVVEAEDQSREFRNIVGTVASTAVMTAILFIPGGVFIDAAIGIAIAAHSVQEAIDIGRAANTGLHVDDGLMTQAQADSARWRAILDTAFAAVGAAGAGLRVLRVARAYQDVSRAFPALQRTQRAQLVRSLSHNTRLLETLLGAGARDDAWIASRVQSAVRELGSDPTALRRTLETTGTLARIPRRVVENDAYAPIRAITDGSDLDAIARVTGINRREVEAAKRHLMVDEHILVDDSGQVYRGHFEAEGEFVAPLWLRAARGRRLDSNDIESLRRLIRHEVEEGSLLTREGRTLEESFVRGELEGMLQRLLSRHCDSATVRELMRRERRPIMPYRYAHYLAHFNGAPN